MTSKKHRRQGSPACGQRIIQRFAYADEMTAQNFTLDNQLEAKYDLAFSHYILLAGVDYFHGFMDMRNGFSFSSTCLIRCTDKPAGELPVATDKPDQTVDQIGLYVQDQIKLGEHLALTGGLRHDWLDNQTEGSRTQRDTALTGWVGRVYLSDIGLAPYVSYSESLFDAMLAYENPHWRVAFNANNLTDESHLSTCGSRGDCFYGSRGSFMGSLAYKF